MNNSADDLGGAIIWVGAYGNLSGCSFVNNSANGNGGGAGAVWWNGDDGVVSGCSFVNNSANGNGGDAGAIYWNNALRGVVCDCSFVDNSASHDGGAIYWDYDSDCGIVSGCSFVNSSASHDGGAIYWYGSSNGNVSGCIFLNNSADNAVIYISSRNLSVNDNIFLNNDAVAVYSDVYNDDANRDYNWFGHNATNYMDNPGIEGCNIWLFLDMTAIPNMISLSDSFDVTFKLSAYNSVEVSEYDNGRLKAVELTLAPTIGKFNVSRTNLGKSVQYIPDGVGTGRLTATVENAECSMPLTVTDGTTFSDLNRAINGNDIVVLDNDYAYNSTVDSGFNDGIVISRAVTIIGNGHAIDAKGQTRIFDVRSGDVVIGNVTFKNAKFWDYGGAIYCEGDNGTVSGCSFVNNSDSNGGAILGLGSVAVSDCIFVNNRADFDGGAVLLCSGVISDSVFVNNTADYHGGAIMWASSDDCVVSGCVFVNNTADDIIYFNNDGNSRNLTINDNIFLNNDGVAISFYKSDSASNVDYNWFGHNATNYRTAPITANVEINNWLFLNATANPDSILISESSDILFKLYSYNESAGISDYDNSRLHAVNLTVGATRGDVEGIAKLDESIRYDATDFGTGTVTAKIENAEYTIEISNLKDNPNLSIETLQVTYSNNTIIVLNYSSIATGKVNITLNGKKSDYAFEDMTLNATIALGDIGADEYEIIVQYSGDDTFANATATGTLTVAKANSTLAVGDVTLDYGTGTTLAVTSEGAVGITAKIDDKEVTVEGNSIRIPVLDAGTYNLTVTAVPDDNHVAVTKTAKITVNKLNTQITANAIAAIYNVNKYLIITLKDSKGNPISGVRLSVNLNGIKTLTTDAKGQVKVSTKGLAPKAYTAAITFNGNNNYIKSTKSVKVTVKKAKPKIVAKKKTFKRKIKTKKYKVTLKNNVGKAMKKVRITLKIGKKTFKAKTNSKGKATFKIKKLTKKGKYKAVIRYNGSKYYYKVTKKVRITIK